MATVDPIILAAQARPIIAKLHKRNDVVVRLKTNRSGFAEDALDELDEAAPGHFRADQRVLTLNLDELVERGGVDSLASIEDFRKYPVLAGVAAHEAAHARFSLWGTEHGEELPETLPNPDFDTFHEHGETCDEPCLSQIVSFPVGNNGKLLEIAMLLEEPRVERLGRGTFTKTWRKAMELSAGHIVMEGIESDEETNGEEMPIDSALRIAILVGGRLAAGTLGQTSESRRSVNKVLASAEKIIDTALPEIEDPYHKVMGLISKQVFNDDHESAIGHLEVARQILKIIHPENADNPNNNNKSDSGGEGEGEGEGEEGDGGGAGTASAALQEMVDGMKDAVADFSASEEKAVRSDEEQSEKTNDKSSGHGAVEYNNPKAPGIDRYEEPSEGDRALRHRATEWMLNQIEPTITETETGQWLPGGGARLDVRGYLRDNMAGHRGSQRSDWSKVSETVKPAPPVKVAIMLDGSGSMGSYARSSASIAWAAANAAADLPESRTVSVVFGSVAAVTQEPGHSAPRKVAVSRTNGPWENFKHAAELVTDALWLDDPIEEGESSNVLIIIVSDMQFVGVGQGEAFMRISKEWGEKGFNIVIVGANPGSPMRGSTPRITIGEVEHTTVVKPEDLFR